MKIRFLVLDIFGMGGTIRTVLNVANYLAENNYDIEIISVAKHSKTPFFEIHPNIKVTVLHNKTSKRKNTTFKNKMYNKLASSPSKLIHQDDEALKLFSLLSDIKLMKTLKSINDGILITTRPSFNILAAKHVSNNVIKIGQEHLNFDIYPERLQRDILNHYVNLDYLATLTSDDTKEYTALLDNGKVEVIQIANSIPKLEKKYSDLSSKTLIAIGRLVPQKGFDLLIDAFKIVNEKHPDWILKIFGKGREHNNLISQIQDNHLYNNVFLMGATKEVEKELEKSSIYVLSSRFEGFGMVIIEAMQCGVPVVTFDCPKGPGEIVEHNVDGLIVEDGNIEKLAESIIELIEDEDKRKAFSLAGIENVKRYEIDTIGEMWIDLFNKALSQN